MEHISRQPHQHENAHKMIFISDLPKNTTYLDLVDYYEKNVGTCQINIKRALFKNYYYAFVMFDTIEDAKKAAEEFRYPRIKDHKMSRALPYNMHAVRGEPGGKDVQSTSIFIKGFEKMKWTHEDLYAKFCTFGKILSCKVSIDPNHNFLGFGYIQFSKIEEAQKAIEKMDKYDLKDDGYDNEGILSVLEYQNKKAVPSKKPFNNVYVKNFSTDPDFTDDQLADLFKSYGEIQNASVMRDQEGKSKGFGFVCFMNPSDAEKATKEVKAMADGSKDETERDPKLFACEAKSKKERTQELTMNNFKYKKSIMFFSLFVKNFPAGTTEEELRIYFQSACNGGEVSKVQIIPGTQQAFVNFEKQDHCKLAKEFARNALFKSSYPLYAEYCYPKEMRAMRNEEFNDKKTQERRKNQQAQTQIQSMQGSQNIIDILTMLLKPAFQFQQTNGNQRRSYSQSTGHHSRHNQMNSGGFNQQMMNGSQMNRGGYNNRGNRSNHHQYQQRGHSMNNMMPNPQQITPQQQMPQMQNQNQSMVSGATSLNSTSTAQVGVPSQLHQYGQAYANEIQQMFMSNEFKNGEIQEKKELVGNTIYKHVEKIVGENKAPKITGMLIDLPEIELNFSISNFTNFYTKVQSAFTLIQESENRTAPGGAQGSPQTQQKIQAL